MSDKWLKVQRDEVRERSARKREAAARVVEARAQARRGRRSI